jgi:hypothetical protein
MKGRLASHRSTQQAADACQSRLGTALALSILQAKLLRQFEIAD